MPLLFVIVACAGAIVAGIIITTVIGVVLHRRRVKQWQIKVGTITDSISRAVALRLSAVDVFETALVVCKYCTICVY